MKTENNDQNIRDLINNLEGLPANVSWSAETGWNNFKQKNRRRNNILTLKILSTAAIVLLGLFLSLIYHNRLNNKYLKLVTDSKSKNQILLNDGSIISLNYNSQISIDAINNKIELSGEAYFELKNKNTYTVFIENKSFIAKSSSFNLKTNINKDETILTVSKGKVELIWQSEEPQNLSIEEGNQATIINELAIVKTPISDPNYLAWKTEELNFNNTPLYCVINKLEELYKVTIDVSDKNIRYCRVSSNIKTTDPIKILETLTNTLNYSIEQNNNRILIKGTGCEI